MLLFINIHVHLANFQFLQAMSQDLNILLRFEKCLLAWKTGNNIGADAMM